MSQVDWQIVKDVFYQALNQPLTERSDFLDSKCGPSGPLRSEVEFLLDSYESGFLETPILADKDQKTENALPLLEQGREFRHYRILRLLGRGGMGEVYLADDLSLERLVAIKVIHADSGFGDQSAERLMREARSAAKLDHPNICSVYEVGETEGMPYIAMQYVEGEMLDKLLDQDLVNFDDAVSYTRQIAAALTRAHSRGIVHRDIKPSNVIIDSEKHVTVLDFGLAKETRINADNGDLSAAGLIAGTLAYMSPEHARGQEINVQTDIWSLGVVFYQMVTGRLPFRGGTKADLVVSILQDEIADAPELSESVKYIVDRALQKDCNLRYASAREFEADLAELAETGRVRSIDEFGSQTISVPTLSATPVPIWNKYIRVALPLILLLSLAGGSYVVFRYRNGSAPPAALLGAFANPYHITTLYDQKQPENGSIIDLSYSPDGTRITYKLSESTNPAIYVISLSSLVPVKITPDNQNNDSPVWSPDGNTIAYLVSIGSETRIATIPAGGGEPLLLWPIATSWKTRLSKWSNDGTRIFFEDSSGLNQIDISTGISSQIDLSGIEGTKKEGIVLSPDESSILVKTDCDANCKLWEKFLEARTAKVISDSVPASCKPSWFPDSKRFVYGSSENGSNKLYVQDIAGAPAQPLATVTGEIEDSAVSPDGSQIVFPTIVLEGNVYSTDLNSLAETQLTKKTYMEALPAISPDGQTIVYTKIDQPSEFPSGSLKLDSLNPSKIPEPLPPDVHACCSEWLPAGDGIIYRKVSGSTYTLWKYLFKDRSEVRLSGLNAPPGGMTKSPMEIEPSLGVSPDGSKIVFANSNSGIKNIWIASIDGSGDSRVTDYNDKALTGRVPLWSPVREQIAYIEEVNSLSGSFEEDRIVFLDHGVKVVSEAFKQRATFLGWSTDGKGVFFYLDAMQSKNIYYQGNDGAAPRLCVKLDNARTLSIHISPDRRSVVFSMRQAEIDNLFVLPISGGEPQPITKNLDKNIFYSGVTWSPDSSRLMYTKQTGGLRINMISPK